MSDTGPVLVKSGESTTVSVRFDILLWLSEVFRRGKVGGEYTGVFLFVCFVFDFCCFL